MILTKITRYKQTHAQISELETILTKGAYIGAGLSVGLGVGKSCYGLQMEICDIDAMTDCLTAILTGLKISLVYQKKMLESEFKACKEFLGET